jgi:predicted AAA+ superfamily ATPase
MIVLDEAQMVEGIGGVCKQIIDAELGIQLILTGSSALNIANLTQEPLTGRKWEYFLYPISCAEMVEFSGTPELLSRLSQYLIYGCYPEVVTNLSNAKQILNNLASSYLYKDVLALTGVKKPLLLEKILKALAWQVGSEVSLNEIAQIVGADVKTVDSYIHLLEQVYVVYRLGAYSGNLRNEINRKKKIYFYDNGIRNALIGNYSLLDDRNDTGSLWENYLITERKKLLAYNGFYGHTYFWRSKAQAEVDYLEEIDGKLYAYEFKWNPAAKSKFPKSFIEAYKPDAMDVIHRDNFWQWLKTYPY